MSQPLKNYVGKNGVPGFVSLVWRDGKLEAEVEGTRTLGGEPLKRDDLFRITSMTKPVTAVATLLLIQKGLMNLLDPIEKWIPELRDRKVLKRMDAALLDSVAAKRPITVEDLLTFRMGFGMIMEFSRRYPIVEEFEKVCGIGLGPPDPLVEVTHEEWMRGFSRLPLMVQPGELWQYGTAYYLLGILLERVTGQKLDQLLRELVFLPLGMSDTSFVVPREKRDRLTDCYWFDSENQKLELFDPGEESQWSVRPHFLDAGAGLVSTADDYLKFALMLLHQGVHDGKPFLKSELVAAMTRNHLTPDQRAKPTFSPDQWRWHGFGYGVSVVTEESRKINGRVGQYGWDGGFGTTWRNDPAEKLVGILLTERTFDSPVLPPICEAFWDGVYGR